MTSKVPGVMMLVIVDLETKFDVECADVFTVSVIKFYTPNSDDSEDIAIKLIALENVHSADIFCEKAT
jgi:hypothetical protein